MYIPTIKQGNITYYKPEAVEVLIAIKEMRDHNWPKPEIAVKLAERFPINADDVQQSVSNESPVRTDAMIAVMSTMGKALDHLGRQDERLREQDSKVVELERKQAEYDELMEKLRSEVAASREKSAELEAKVKELQEEKQVGFWARLFGGK
jgi:DNA-binding transcriptional MerR regulator